MGLQTQRFEPEFLKTLLRPHPAEGMACCRVSKLVNSAIHLTCLRPASSSMVIRTRNRPLRRHRPRTACLRLSSSLVYLWQRELELEPACGPGVAARFLRPHRRKYCCKPRVQHETQL
jgi:hypothetical protein